MGLVVVGARGDANGAEIVSPGVCRRIGEGMLLSDVAGDPMFCMRSLGDFYENLFQFIRLFAWGLGVKPVPGGEDAKRKSRGGGTRKKAPRRPTTYDSLTGSANCFVT